MYYREEWINGKLMYKHTPNGEWKEFSKEMLYKRIIEREEEILSLKYDLQRLENSNINEEVDS